MNTSAYRCFFADGSCRIVRASSHLDAALQAQEEAWLEAKDMPATGPVNAGRITKRIRVVKTLSLSNGDYRRWDAPTSKSRPVDPRD